MSARILTSSAVALLCAAALPAQNSRALHDESVPKELVEALLTGPGNPRVPTIVVGEVPGPLAGKLYIPAQARVLGGTTSALSSTVIFVSSLRPQQVHDEIVREQPKLGWTAMPQNGLAPMIMTRGGGFRDAPDAGGGLADSPTVPMSFCSGNTTLFVTIDPQNLVESRVTARSTADAGTCRYLAQQAAAFSSPTTFRDPSSTFRWPVLINPPGTHSNYGACEQMNFGGGGNENQLPTRLTPEELFAHYGKQLADSGWKQTAQITTSRSWERTDSLGRRQQVEILIRSMGPGIDCQQVSMSTRAMYR